jgi:hypothetical protein
MDLCENASAAKIGTYKAPKGVEGMNAFFHFRHCQISFFLETWVENQALTKAT